MILNQFYLFDDDRVYTSDITSYKNCKAKGMMKIYQYELGMVFSVLKS